MKFSEKTVLLLLITLFFFSCNSEKQSKVEGEVISKVDTLYYHEKIYLDKDGFAQPRKIFKYKSKTKNKLPKNEEILMTLVYEGDFKELVKHMDVDFVPETDKLKIEKIDNYHFKLFINPDYSEQMISMHYYLTPKKNYVMKVYFQDKLVKHPEKTIGASFNQLVEQD